MARKSTIIIVAVIVGILVMGGMSVLLQITVDTTGHSYYSKGLKGNSIEGGYTKDLFDSPDYVTAFTSDGLSEKIVINTAVYFTGFPVGDGPAGVIVDKAWYKLTFEGKGPFTVDYYGVRSTGNEWVRPPYKPPWSVPVSKQWIQLITGDIIRLVGPVTGKVHIDFYCHHYWIDYSFGIPIIKDAVTLFATDEAYLQSGLGSVAVPPYTEEGTDMVLKVTAENSHSETGGGDGPGGWSLLLFNNKGLQVKSWEIPDRVSGYTVKYPVPLGVFDPTPGANNNWKVELWNNLFRTHATYTVVIKQATVDIMPPPPSIKSESGEPPYEAGTPLKWLITGEKNPKGYNIAGFRVSVQYSSTQGQLGDYIIENQWYSALANPDGKTWSCSVEFTAPQTGYYVISAQSVDAMNNPSVIATLRIETSPPGTTEPSLGEGYDWLTLVIGIVAIVLGLIIGILIIMYVPPPIGLLIGLVIIIVCFAIGGYELYQFFSDAQDRGLLIVQQTLFRGR